MYSRDAPTILGMSSSSLKVYQDESIPEGAGAVTTELAVRRLAIEHRNWLPVLGACLTLAERTGDVGFAGRWVLQELNQRPWAGMKYGDNTAHWFPNLRILVRWGILEHRDTTRGGRRAYYTMPDPDGVRSALIELAAHPALNTKLDAQTF